MSFIHFFSNRKHSYVKENNCTERDSHASLLCQAAITTTTTTTTTTIIIIIIIIIIIQSRMLEKFAFSSWSRITLAWWGNAREIVNLTMVIMMCVKILENYWWMLPVFCICYYISNCNRNLCRWWERNYQSLEFSFS